MDVYLDSTIEIIKLENLIVGFVMGFVLGLVVFWLPRQIKKGIKKSQQSQLGNAPK